MSTRRRAFRAAFIQSIPVMLGYLFVGIAFGMLLRDKGYPIHWAVLMSTVIYAGSMQFMAINLLTMPVSIWQMVIVTLVINFRHIFYGLSFIERFQSMGLKRHYMVFSLTDETYSLLVAAQPQPGIDQNQSFFYISLLNQLYWIIGSAAGSLIGGMLPFDSTGIDFAMTALFVVIFVEQCRAERVHTPALIGFGCAIVCLWLFGAQNFILPALFLLLAALFILRKPIEAGIQAQDAAKEGTK